MKNDLEQKRRLKKFFYLGALCLLPILGPLFGIVLLVYAVFIFKNIKLIVVILFAMAGGFGVTKLYSVYMRHDILYGKDAENAYFLLARNDLDAIARNLALYRVRHQRYPDSLKQLEKDNPQLFIKDPLQARNHSRDPKIYPFVCFYYIPKDTAYELFSAGVDGIPHTQDDIYPQKPLR
jgi:hypothetical protein